MSKTFYTSDTHFGHAAIIDYCGRPFKKSDGQMDIPAMNETLIRNWNSVVGPEDVVYHLGDFAMGQRIHWPAIRKALNGKLILVEGNHDRKYREWMLPGDEHYPWLFIDGVFMTHVPPAYNDHAGRTDLVCPPIPEGVKLILCGHVHDAWAETTYVHNGESIRVVNAGVDVRSYKPVTMEELCP